MSPPSYHPFRSLALSVAFATAMISTAVRSSISNADEGIASAPGIGWKRHTIDDRFDGADGVRLADFDGDGLQDIATGWEESGLVCVYKNPGPKRARESWQSVIVGKFPSPEDAFFGDVDGDGILEVVSCHEGKEQRIWVHRLLNPDENLNTKSKANNDAWLSPENWQSTAITPADGAQWMYAASVGTVDQANDANRNPSSKRGFAMVVGSKNKTGSISLLTFSYDAYATVRPEDNSTKAATTQPWKIKRLRDCGWIMSLQSSDVDGDGDLDIVYSDRKGDDRALGWLEHPGDLTQPWPDHRIEVPSREWMFLSLVGKDWIVATRDHQSLRITNPAGAAKVDWINHPDGIRFGKSIAALPSGDLVLSANTHAQKRKDLPGIWIRDMKTKVWSPIDPTTHVKFDRIELVDLDNDGDLDVLCCEERHNLGVFWYENPKQ